jgi:hypothetical protein
VSGTIIEPVSEGDAPLATAPSRVLVNFPNDHDISGMKIEIANVTPEQIAVMIFHLQRSASQIADMRQLQAESERREIARVAADIRSLRQ